MCVSCDSQKKHTNTLCDEMQHFSILQRVVYKLSTGLSTCNNIRWSLMHLNWFSFFIQTKRHRLCVCSMETQSKVWFPLTSLYREFFHTPQLVTDVTVNTSFDSSSCCVTVGQTLLYQALCRPVADRAVSSTVQDCC